MKSSPDKKKKLAESGMLNPHAASVTDPLFENNDFFDADDLLQTKYEMLRRVEKEKMPVTTAADSFGFSRRHFYVLQKQFAAEGLHGLLSEKRGPKGAHKLNEEVMNFIDAQIEKDPSLKAPGIGLLLKKRFGIKAHRRSIERALDRKKKGKKL
jgi:transposase